MVAVMLPFYLQWGWFAAPVAPTPQSGIGYFTADRARDYDKPHMVRLNDLRSGFTTPSGDLQVSGMRKGPEPTDE